MGSAILRQITPTDRDWVLEQHELIYMDGHGFDASFKELVAQILDDFFFRSDHERENGWIAEKDGQPLGSIFCTYIDDDTAQLRLFFLVNDARGQGLGRRMIETLTQFARAVGYKKVILLTHRSHVSACALYRASGWRLIEEKPTVSFGNKEVVETYVYNL